MGHKIKTKNRGDAIALNKKRVTDLRKECTEKFEDVVKTADAAALRLTAFGERLDVLEEFMGETKNILAFHQAKLRPWWVRLWGWARRIGGVNVSNL